MVSYGASNFSSGYMGTVAFNCSGFSYNNSTGTAVLTAPSGAVTGVELPILSHSSEPTTTIIKIMNSKSGKVPLKDVTFTDDENIEIVIDYDFLDNPFLAAGGGAVAGATIPWVVLFLNQSHKSALDGKYRVYSSMIVKSTPLKVAVNDKIGLSLKLEASGPYWDPQS
jgi:hypothetical protein